MNLDRVPPAFFSLPTVGAALRLNVADVTELSLNRTAVGYQGNAQVRDRGQLYRSTFMLSPGGVFSGGACGCGRKGCSHLARALLSPALDRELDTAVADPAARARDLTGGWFTDAETTTVTLRLAPPARWVIEYYQVTAQRPGPDGTIDVDLEVASEQWAQALLFRLAPHATLIAPADYADTFTAAARSTLSLYGTDGVDS